MSLVEMEGAQRVLVRQPRGLELWALPEVAVQPGAPLPTTAAPTRLLSMRFKRPLRAAAARGSLLAVADVAETKFFRYAQGLLERIPNGKPAGEGG